MSKYRLEAECSYEDVRYYYTIAESDDLELLKTIGKNLNENLTMIDSATNLDIEGLVISAETKVQRRNLYCIDYRHEEWNENKHYIAEMEGENNE